MKAGRVGLHVSMFDNYVTELADGYTRTIFKLFVYFRRRECLAQNNYSNHSSHWCVEHSHIRSPIEQDNEFNIELMGEKIMGESLRVDGATN